MQRLFVDCASMIVLEAPLTLWSVIAVVTETALVVRYVPFVTSTVSPFVAALIAVWMLVAAVAQFV